MSLEDSIVVEPFDPSKQAAPVVKTENTVPEQPVWLTTAIPADASDIDARYRGKSVKEIIAMNEHAQSTIGRQSQEVGVWRKLVQDLGQAQVLTSNQVTTEQEEALQLTAEDLLRDPGASIARVVAQAVKKELTPVNQKLEVRAQADSLSSLKSDFPKMGEWGKDQNFLQWTQGTSSRREDANAVATRNDPIAARRLLEAYEERLAFAESLKPVTTGTVETKTQTILEPVGKPQGLAGARVAATESGGGTRAGVSGKVYSTKEITDMIINNPEHYRSDAFQTELKAAAREGRIQ